jgi:hypothetical protein
MNTSTTYSPDTTKHLCQAADAQIQEIKPTLQQQLQKVSQSLSDTNPVQALQNWHEFLTSVSQTTSLLEQVTSMSTGLSRNEIQRQFRSFSPRGQQQQQGYRKPNYKSIENRIGQLAKEVSRIKAA